MEKIVKRNDFLKLIENVKLMGKGNGLTTDAPYVLFSGTHIISYNDKISIQCPFKTDFSLFVKTKDLHALVTKISSETIKLKENNNKLNVYCPYCNANLATIENDEIAKRITHVQKPLAGIKWKTLPENFCKSILLCSYSVSDQESIPILTCVYIDRQNCISSDNARIAIASLSNQMDKMLIKATEIKRLVATNPTTYAISKSWLHFKNSENSIFSVRKVFGKFPALAQFFEFKGTEITLPKKLSEGLDTTSIFADELSPFVSLLIGKNLCKISTKSDSGAIQYKVKIDYNEEPIKFMVNPSFLKEMMQYSSSMCIQKDRVKLETKDFKFVSALYKG